MALIKCYECNKEISNTAKICPYCGVNLKKEKRKRDIEKRINKAYTIKDLQQRNIKNYYNKNKKIVITCITFIVIFIIGSFSYFNYYNFKVNEMKKSLQGTWHDYIEYNEKWTEWKIEINGDTLTDKYGNYYIIKWYPFDNEFVANGSSYEVADDFNSINRLHYNYTKPNIYSNPSEVLEITITKKETKDKYVECVGTIKNNSIHTFKYIKLNGEFLNVSNNSFINEEYEFRNLKPNEIKDFIFTNDWYFINYEPQWTMKDCRVNILQAKT